MLQGFFQ